MYSVIPSQLGSFGQRAESELLRAVAGLEQMGESVAGVCEALFAAERAKSSSSSSPPLEAISRGAMGEECTCRAVPVHDNML